MHAIKMTQIITDFKVESILLIKVLRIKNLTVSAKKKAENVPSTLNRPPFDAADQW